MSDLLKRLELASCHPVHGGDVMEAIDHIEVLQHEVDMWRKHVVELEAILQRVEEAGHAAHISWNASKDYNLGWKDCRDQIEEALAGDKV